MSELSLSRRRSDTQVARLGRGDTGREQVVTQQLTVLESVRPVDVLSDVIVNNAGGVEKRMVCGRKAFRA